MLRNRSAIRTATSFADHAGDELHDHDRGLSFDVSTLMSRRRSLSMLGVAGLGVAGLGLAACDPSSSDSTSTTTSGNGGTTATTGATATTAAGSCAVIPEETAGPYPGDGSNGVNVLNQSGIVRSDIRSSFGSSTTTAEGVPLTVKLKVVDTADGCAALPGAAVYLWHCDINGKYSMYSQGVTGENYLRGVQEADDEGWVTFTTIFPAAYSGRWPHIHFEVYPSVDSATAASSKLRTSQLALPEDACNAVFATSGYSTSIRNMAQTSLSNDNVFSDGSSLQTPSMSGSVSDGYVATLTVPV